jgi:hypothetical protein
MPTDALVLEHPGPSARMTTELQELHRLFLPAGRSYVVFAKGQLFARHEPRATLRLDAFDAVDEARFVHLPLGEPTVVLAEARLACRQRSGHVLARGGGDAALS